jgi:hypothetical protein
MADSTTIVAVMIRVLVDDDCYYKIRRRWLANVGDKPSGGGSNQTL